MYKIIEVPGPLILAGGRVGTEEVPTGKTKCLYCNKSLVRFRTDEWSNTPWGEGNNQSKYIRRYHKKCFKLKRFGW
jgi:hypothetical protein